MPPLAADTTTELPTSSSTRPLSVCLASMAPFVGGAEVAAARLGQGLQEAGHRVVVLVGRPGDALDLMRQSGLRCEFAPMYFRDKWRWMRYLRGRSRLTALFERDRPDLIHSNDVTTHQIVSDAARRLSIPRICHHRFNYEPAFIEWLIQFGAEHHLFVSRALMGQVCRGGDPWDAASRAVVYDGLPMPDRPSHARQQAFRARAGLAADRVLVTFAGQLIPRKGVADLLTAWSLLGDDLRRQAELVILGDDLAGRGRYRVEMQDLARRLNVPVRFEGFQRNVGDWLASSDISVVPSHEEPLGNATLEAMSHGLPVVGSAVGGIPEMVVHGETGLLVRPADPAQLAEALRQIIPDPDLRRTMGERGRERCEERFTLRAHVDAVVREYEGVLARSRGSAPS